MEEPKPITTEFGSFRIRLFYVPAWGSDPAGWRGEIAGVWRTPLLDDQKAVRKYIAKHGKESLAQLLEALDAAGKNRS